MLWRAPRLRQHLALGAVGTMLVAFADGAISWARAPNASGAWAAPWLAACVMIAPGILLGGAAYLVERVLLQPRPLWVLRPSAGAESEAKGRHLSVALALAMLVTLGALGAGAYVRFAQRLQDEGFAERLSIFLVGLGLCVLLALVHPLSLLLHGATRRWLLRTSSTWLVAGGVVLTIGLSAFMLEDAPALGVLLVLPYCCVLGMALSALWLSPFCERIAIAFGSRRSWIVLGAAWLLSAPLLRMTPQALSSTLGAGAVAELFASISDVDGDGQSALFGGRDCAAFDDRRHPLAYDIPNNAIDEDCSGRDALHVHGAAPVHHERTPLPKEFRRKYNIVLIVIDAFRAERLGLGKKRSLTPALDRFALESVVFTEAHSQSSTTRISFPSFLSGRSPQNLVWIRKNGWLQSAGSEKLLAERLSELGYATNLVVNGWIYDRLSELRRGYDRVWNARKPQGQAIAAVLSGPSTTARGIELIEQNAARAGTPRPFFLTLYYEGPHAPYDDLTQFGFKARTRHPIDRYDAEIRFVDQSVGHLLDHLRLKPRLWANTVVVVLADHGEEFGEHGGSEHSRTCYGESTRVPLLMRVPKLPPALAPARVALVDVVPTLLELIGAEKREKLDGRIILFADPVRYDHEPDQRVFCAFFDDRRPGATLIQSVRDQEHLYIEHANGAFELYDTSQDAAEAKNLISSPSAKARMNALRQSLHAPRFQTP